MSQRLGLYYNPKRCEVQISILLVNVIIMVDEKNDDRSFDRTVLCKAQETAGRFPSICLHVCRVHVLYRNQQTFCRPGSPVFLVFFCWNQSPVSCKIPREQGVKYTLTGGRKMDIFSANILETIQNRSMVTVER